MERSIHLAHRRDVKSIAFKMVVKGDMKKAIYIPDSSLTECDSQRARTSLSFHNHTKSFAFTWRGSLCSQVSVLRRGLNWLCIEVRLTELKCILQRCLWWLYPILSLKVEAALATAATAATAPAFSVSLLWFKQTCCRGSWDTPAEGSRADCWSRGLIGPASPITMGLNSWDGRITEADWPYCPEDGHQSRGRMKSCDLELTESSPWLSRLLDPSPVPTK